MADIELVVKMPEEVYKSIINGKNYISYQEYVEEAIKNSTPLPKGHGELKDATKALAKMQKYHDDCAKTSTYTRLGFETAMGVIADAETLVEADKE